MHRFNASLKLLGRIIHAFTLWERVTVLLLTGVVLASTAQLTAGIIAPLTGSSGKTLYTEGLVGQPKLLNPLFADFNDVDRDIGSLIFSGLVLYDPDVSNFVPNLAENVERSKDNKTYTVTIRQNALWHDGQPVTSDDVIFTFSEVIQDPGFKNAPLRTAFKGISISKIDERTISFTLPQVNSFFISYLTTGIIPKHILGTASIAEIEKNPFNKKPIGSGPYRYPESAPALFDGQTQLTLESFENFYGEKPNISHVRFLFFPDAETMVKEQSSLNGIAKLRGGLKTGIPEERFKMYTYKLPQLMTVFFNMESQRVQSKHLRQALVKSVDKNTLLSKIDDAVRVDRMYFSEAPDEWIHVFDVAAANKILSDQGWSMGDDGFRHNSRGETLSLTVLSKRFTENTPLEEETQLLLATLRNFWQDIGIQITIRRETGDTFSELLQKREYDMFVTGQSLGDNFDTYAFWHSTQRGTSGGLNFSELQSFRVDSAIEDLRLTFDSKKKRQKMEFLEDLIEEETPALFLY
ncbi:MAG: peptide ABC transporter substrate-binding protein, partial [Patescibacteria group bacterium]